MTDFTVRSTAFQVEKRSWLQSMPDADDCDSIVLDITKFSAGTHFPNGFIPSGCGLAKVTATGLYGPYDTTASDGRQLTTAPLYLLFNSSNVVHRDGSSATKLVVAGLAAGTVADLKLPFQSGSGSLDAAAKTALKFIRFVTAA
jgi:hypothetical protein